MPFPWYQTIGNSNEIQQGDLIPNCPIVIPPSNLVIPQSEDQLVELDETLQIKTLNTIVLSQSCDLENNKVEIVLVCPYYTLTDFFAQMPTTDQTGRGRIKKLEALKQGNLPSYHLLNKGSEVGLQDFSVVDFRNVYGVNFDFLKTFIGPISSRARLLPPYREHLSQAFARFFMRVGLPNDIEGLS